MSRLPESSEPVSDEPLKSPRSSVAVPQVENPMVCAAASNT